MGKRKRNFARGQLTKSKRRDSESTSRRDVASRVLRRDSESTSRPENVSGQENKTLGRDLESISRMDNASGVEYDVYLCFRGSDTRLTFVDYLYCSLKRAGMRVFLDSEELELGEQISELLNALNKSRIYIIIFSQNFASSIWCLREVERIVECHSKSNGKKEIIPIFYNVKTDDVKLRTYLYKKAILKHKKMKKFASEEVLQWESALKTVGKLIGLELQNKRHGEQIESIVEVVSRKLNTRDMIVTEHLVEDNAQLEALMKLLDVGSNGVRFIGVYGMGGIGKTTLTTVLYNKLSFHFEGCCFLQDVRVHWQHPGGPPDLQKRLLLDFVDSSITDQIKDVGGGMKMIKKVLCTKKVLIVLDDLDKKEQLEKLAGKSDWFGSGSRIIITTRDESILMTQVESTSKENRNQTEGILRYTVQEMQFDQALQLFYKHAFRSDSPIGYDALSKKIVCKVARLPLAVEVIGSYLYQLGLATEQHGDKIKLLEETLEKLDEGPFKGVRDALMISFEGLEDKEKKIFLDIASFFINEDQIYPIIMWEDCKYHPHSAIRVLRLRSLIKIIDNKFRMHDQLQDLARHIILQEQTHQVSRVWKYEDAVELLKRKERNEHVEALSLTSCGCNRNLAAEELFALPNLRFLRVRGLDFSGDFKNLLSKLRWLSWQTLQTTFHANNFHFSNLVVLNLSCSNIEDNWDGWSQMKMNKLKVLDLTGCPRLKMTPDFSNFKSLEKLILARCVQLTTIDSSIGKLKLLRTFNINGCWVLQELPVEFGSLQSLTEIVMPKNYQPFKLPETFGNLVNLSTFILDEHPAISQLPKSIGGLAKLTRLSLRGCVGIQKLPCSIGDMEMLVELDLSTSGIVELPDSIGLLKKLKVIKVSYTKIRKFPRTIGQVEMLEELHAKNCWNLMDETPKEIGKLSRLRILDMSYSRVARFPAVLGCLSHLQILEMSSSRIQKVPDLPSSLTRLHIQARYFPYIPDLSSLVSLAYLELSKLTYRMEEPDPIWTNDLPEEQPIHPLPSSLSTLKFRGINPLPPFSDLKNLSVLCVIEYPMPCFSVHQDLKHLRELKLSKCQLLVEISGLSCLKSLQYLHLNRLVNLVEMHGLLELESLLHFRIAYCNKIEILPNLSKLDKLRRIELEACLNIREIKGIKGMEGLKLDNRGCDFLERVLDDPGSIWFHRKIPVYDVFLSFRGSDTDYNIVEILYNNFDRNKIRTFLHAVECDYGKEMQGQILRVFDDSYSYVPLLSREYVSSSFCLHELAHIVQCTSTSNGEKRILPIFYNMENDDVKREADSYQRALDEHSGNFNIEMKEWEVALREVAGIKGYHLKTNSLEEEIETITEEVLRVLGNAKIRRPQAVED